MSHCIRVSSVRLNFSQVDVWMVSHTRYKPPVVLSVAVSSHGHSRAKPCRPRTFVCYCSTYLEFSLCGVFYDPDLAISCIQPLVPLAACVWSSSGVKSPSVPSFSTGRHLDHDLALLPLLVVASRVCFLWRSLRRPLWVWPSGNWEGSNSRRLVTAIFLGEHELRRCYQLVKR